jgi:hypothetical protein
MNIDYNAFEGWPIEGRPSLVTVRGEVAARDGKFVGTVGRGRLLQRSSKNVFDFDAPLASDNNRIALKRVGCQ